MKTLHGQALGKELRALSDSARNRVWIVSPYIGRWPAVAALLGAKWWQGSVLPFNFKVGQKVCQMDGVEKRRR